MAHTTFPTDLPVPVDDGLCSHLTPGTPIPSLTLPTTDGKTIDPSTLSPLTVIFCYPRTGAPNEVVPDEWNSIPGARGCTPQACGFRDRYAELQKLGVDKVYGLSTQDTEYQREIKERVHLPYELVSDEKLGFQKSLKLPTFEYKGKTLIRRLTIVVREGKVVNVFYPVFPPDKSADEVVEWLKQEQRR